MKYSLLAASLVLGLATAAQAELIYGLTTLDGATGDSLVKFDSATPASATVIGPVTGATNLRGIDFRPANGQLYGMGFTTTTNTAQLYTINTTTGAASAVGAPLVLPTMAASARISLDFNPVVDRLRVVSGNGGNVRVNPNDGTLTATDTSLATALLVGGIAYDRNNAGATLTTLYAYEYIGDNIGTIGGIDGMPSPNGGTFTVIGSTNPPASAFSAGNGFDISGATGIAYLSMDEASSLTEQAEFYTINLATGGATLVDDEIGYALLDISVAPVPEPTTLGAFAAAGLLLLRRRA